MPSASLLILAPAATAQDVKSGLDRVFIRHAAAQDNIGTPEVFSGENGQGPFTLFSIPVSNMGKGVLLQQEVTEVLQRNGVLRGVEMDLDLVPA